jgi:hypothetical protein
MHTSRRVKVLHGLQYTGHYKQYTQHIRTVQTSHYTTIKKPNPSLDHTYSDKRNMQLLHTYPSRNGHLVSFKDPPLPATLTYKTLPTQAHTIAMTIHVHAQEWLTLMSKVSRTNLTKPRKTSKYATHTNNDK